MYVRGPSGRRETRKENEKKKNGNGNSSQELKWSALANTRQEMNAQQTRSECKERKFCFVFFMSVRFHQHKMHLSCGWIIGWCRTAKCDEEKTHLFSPRWRYECEFVCFACFLFIFFRFYEEIYTQQWQHNTIFRSSLLCFFLLLHFAIWMFSFIFHSRYHGSTIFAHIQRKNDNFISISLSTLR